MRYRRDVELFGPVNGKCDLSISFCSAVERIVGGEREELWINASLLSSTIVFCGGLVNDARPALLV